MQELLALLPPGIPREALWLLVIPALMLLIKLSHAGRRINQDPQRMFNGQQRKLGHDRASRRCEMDNWLFMRCRADSKEADHHYPHTRGGASSMENLVAACMKHNRSKSAKMPTRLATWRITRRRKRYFPAGDRLAPGQWFDPRHHG